MPSYNFENTRYSVSIETDDQVRNIRVEDRYSSTVFADGPYRYGVAVDNGESVNTLYGCHNPQVDVNEGEKEAVVVITGHMGSPNSGLKLNHQFRFRKHDYYFEEQLTLTNETGRDLILRSYRFGLRKHLVYDVQADKWTDGMARFRFIAVPFRITPDGKKHDYTMSDIYQSRYQHSVFDNPMRMHPEAVDRGRDRSEAWAWSNGEYGLLIMKYNPDTIEYSMLETENIDGDTYLCFGGASTSLHNEPREMRDFDNGLQASFGLTRYTFYEGLWRSGSYIFRDFMAAHGHGLSETYDPPVHWNVLFDLGWHHNDQAQLREHYNRGTLEGEAEKARDIGCELLYLDPGWEICEGTTRWDEERLGPVKEFVSYIKENYGLDVGFRTIGRSYCDDYRGMYRRHFDGGTGYYAPFSPKPFYEPCVDYERYRSEKLERILKIADAGMKFIMFDEFDWRGPCFSKEHGHPVPTTPGQHARGVVDIIKKVHAKHPDILIEMHDPVWPWGVKYLPVYFLHGPGSFDEGWAFEFMWDPIQDLLSGKAISLFYYNLAYELPLYNHITMEHDNDNLLAFWWYASTVRHLGIGGKKGLGSKQENEQRYQLYKDAMREYMSLKDLYTRGKFYGFEETIHLHVLPEEGKAVINAFNFSSEPVSREVTFNLQDIGITETVTVEGASCKTVGARVAIRLEIPPMSPIIVKILTQGG